MEAVPRLPMVHFELKTSPDRPLDFSKVKNYIREFYNEDPESYNSEIRNLETLRATAVHPVKDVTGCAVLKKYFCQLHFLQSRFPMGKDGRAAINFSWKDIYGGSVTQAADIKTEIVAILYNIGALHSQLGAASDRTSPEGLKLACSHFQCAAWAFQHLKDTYPQPPGVELSTELMQFKYQLCLAQAQECILEKSMTDNRKATINAKVATQIVDYYNLSLNVLILPQAQDDPSIQDICGSKAFKVWKKYIKFKIAYYSCVTLLYQGMQSEEQQKMGERIAYYQGSLDKLTKAIKLAKGVENSEAVMETLVFTRDVVEGKKKAAKNENEYIYHEGVPDLDSLPNVKGASLVKGIPFDINDPEISGPDIFSRLVPMKAHEASSLYSEEKAKLLRKINAMIDMKDEEIVSFMSCLQLDYLKAHLEMNSFPQEVIDRCAALSAMPDAISNLENVMDKLNEACNVVDGMLNELSELIKEEEAAEKEYQELMGPRPPSIVATDLTREMLKYIDCHKKASESNNTLQNVKTAHIENLRNLQKPLSEIQASLPTLTHLNLHEDKTISDVILLVNKVNEMRKQRAMLASQLRESICSDDITGILITRTDEKMEDIFSKEMQKHNKYVTLIEQNLAAQENIVQALTDAYAQYAPTRKATTEIMHQREMFLRGLISSYDAYEDLIEKTTKGLDFYKKLESNVSKVLLRVKSTCKVQQEERDSILDQNTKKALKIVDSATSEPKTLKHYLQKDTAPSSPYYNPIAASENPSWLPGVRPAPLGSEANAPVCTGSSKQLDSTTQSSVYNPQTYNYTASYQQYDPSKFSNQSAYYYHTLYSQNNPLKSVQYPNMDGTMPQEYDFNPYNYPVNSSAYTADHDYAPSSYSSSANSTPQHNYQGSMQYSSSVNKTTPQHLQANKTSSSNLPQYQAATQNQPYLNTSHSLPYQSANPQYQNANVSPYQTPASAYQTVEQYPTTVTQAQQYLNPVAQTQYTSPATLPKNPSPVSQIQTSTAQTLQYSMPETPNPYANPATQASQYPTAVTQSHYTTSISPMQQYSTSQTPYSTSVTQAQQYPISTQTQYSTTVTQSQQYPISSQTQYSTSVTLAQQYPISSQTQYSTSVTQQYSTSENQSYITSVAQNQYSTSVTQASQYANLQYPGQNSVDPSIPKDAPSTQSQYTTNLSAPQYQDASSPNLNQTYQINDSQKYADYYGYQNYSTGQWTYQNYPEGYYGYTNTHPQAQFQQTPGTDSSYYSRAGTKLPDSTLSPTSNVPFNPSINSEQNPTYYATPYGYYNSASPGVPSLVENNTAKQNSVTYMQASNSKQDLTVTYSQTKQVSNVDLLADLDFTVSDAPLLPTQSKVETKVEKAQEQLSSLSLNPSAAENSISAPPKTQEMPKTEVERPSPSKTPLKDPFSDQESLSLFVQEVEKFEKFVEGLNSKTLNGPTALDLKWNELQDSQQKDAHKLSISVARCYPMKNRFADILPYDDSRVELPSTKDDYINASFVKDLGPGCPNFIMTQAPLPSTYADFWTMVLEQHVELIVCLLSESQMNNEIYWPQNKNEDLIFAKLKISLQSSNVRNYWIERIISVSDGKTSKVVVHLEFTTWPNSWLPESPGPLLNLVNETYGVWSQQRGRGPVVVHCQSGVGRTGVFVFVALSMSELKIPPIHLPDPIGLISQIAKFRKNPIRDRQHLQFAYQCLLYYTQDLLMKRGILASRSTFEEKRPKSKSHTRHPSEDFLLNSLKDHQERRQSDASSTSSSSKQAEGDPLSQLDPLWPIKRYS